MTHGALFNGIAGFPLAAQWAGIKTTWTVEIDEFCNKVSKKHFPHAIQYTDIHEASNLPYVDIISGGFPCQPFSVAGKQLGNEDDRALWPQMLRIIREVRPAYVIGENVTGIISLALDEVLASLEAEGYTTETFIVPACGVNAPHRRDRVWVVAYCKRPGQLREEQLENNKKDSGEWGGPYADKICKVSQPDEYRDVAYTKGKRLERLGDQGEGRSEKAGIYARGGFTGSVCTTWENFPSQSPICGRDDGISSGLVRDRAKQLKAYGNAIVPQVAYEIFKAISELLKVEKGGG